jgi:hypothetical protein
MVLEYTCTMVRTYTYTNITLSQKQLEIQALSSGATGTLVGVVSIEGVTVYYS